MLALNDDARWAQAGTRDRAADGRFWCGVSTPGVHRRPDILGSARGMRAGACKRSRPDAA